MGAILQSLIKRSDKIMDLLKFKRGIFSNLPKKLEIGEPAYCYDTGELYIGNDEGVPELLATPVIVIDGGTFNAITSDDNEIIMDGGEF